jgi:uncharacterized protein (TIGR02117 family)
MRRGYNVVLRWLLLYPTLGLVAGAVLLAIAAITPRRWGFTQTEPCDYKIYVSGDHFHTNLWVPVETPVFRWRDQLDLTQVGGDASQFRYLQFGWGDRIFFVETPSWEQVQLSNALRALFRPGNASALLVKGHAALPEMPNDTVRCLRLGKTDYLALMAFINNSFQTNGAGKQRLASGQDRQSSFYAATGTYSIFNTCNSWTADSLRAANVNTPLWAGLAPPLMQQIRNGCECDEQARKEGVLE